MSPPDEPDPKRIRLTFPAHAASSQSQLGLESSSNGAVEHDLGIAPGKERERDPVLGGELSNLGPPSGADVDGMEVDEGEEGEKVNGKYGDFGVVG
jgi:hypothetical protein